MKTKPDKTKVPAKVPKTTGKVDVSNEGTAALLKSKGRGQTSSRKAKQDKPKASIATKKKKASTALIKKPAGKINLPPLNDKEERFCVEYAASDNAVRSFMFIWPGYGYQSAATESTKLLKKPLIKQRITEIKEERRKRFTPTVDLVISELIKLATYDPAAFFDADGRLKPIDEIRPDDRAVIAGIETLHKTVGESDDGVVVLTKIKLPDKGANLERLGKHLKIFTEKHEFTGKDGGPIETRELSPIQRAARISHLLKTAATRKDVGDKPV